MHMQLQPFHAIYAVFFLTLDQTANIDSLNQAYSRLIKEQQIIVAFKKIRGAKNLPEHQANLKKIQ